MHHPELTRERSIRFLLFEIKSVFVYNSTVFWLTDLFVYTFSLKICKRGQIVIESQFSEILTEPLNSRGTRLEDFKMLWLDHRSFLWSKFWLGSDICLFLKLKIYFFNCGFSINMTCNREKMQLSDFMTFKDRFIIDKRLKVSKI